MYAGKPSLELPLSQSLVLYPMAMAEQKSPLQKESIKFGEPD